MVPFWCEMSAGDLMQWAGLLVAGVTWLFLQFLGPCRA